MLARFRGARDEIRRRIEAFAREAERPVLPPRTREKR
jgi:hypothetical protein